MTIQHVFFNVHFDGQSKTFTQAELSEFAHTVGLDRVVKDRYSWLFVMRLFLYMQVHGINPFQIIAEIKVLEEDALSTGTKTATQFSHFPLKGLWHKHYFCARFIAKNIVNELSGGRLSALVEEVLDPARSPIITDEMIKELSHRVVHETLEGRQAQGKLTGEWIIFAKHGGKNYYLSLSTHNAGDQAIFDEIKSICYPQFPFLKSAAWLL